MARVDPSFSFPLLQQALTWGGSHAYEAAAVAEAATPVSLISRCRVIVECEVRFAGRGLHADRITSEYLAFAALTQLRTLGFVIPIKLQEKK
jgi:hypothetical protein